MGVRGGRDFEAERPDDTPLFSVTGCVVRLLVRPNMCHGSFLFFITTFRFLNGTGHGYARLIYDCSITSQFNTSARKAYILRSFDSSMTPLLVYLAKDNEAGHHRWCAD